MEYKRKGQQSHALVKEVKGNQVPGKIQPYKNAVYNQIKSEISFIAILVLHIPECIDTGENPDNCDHRHKQPPHRIHLKIDRKPHGQLKQRKGSLSAADYPDDCYRRPEKAYGGKGYHGRPFY